jgi:hypothetical protein
MKRTPRLAYKRWGRGSGGPQLPSPWPELSPSAGLEPHYVHGKWDLEVRRRCHIRLSLPRQSPTEGVGSPGGVEVGVFDFPRLYARHNPEGVDAKGDDAQHE